MTWYGMTWYGMTWYGMTWYGMTWYGMTWYGAVAYVLFSSDLPADFAFWCLREKKRIFTYNNYIEF